MTADPLDLLLSPRETLRVLDYLGAHPEAHADDGCEALSISRHTWYRALRQLEGLNLVVVERYPGGRKVRSVTLTPEGKGTLPLLRGLRELAQGSPIVLEAELDASPPRKGSAEAGEALLRLAEFGERRGDFGLLERVASRGEALGRPGEAQFATALAAFTIGDVHRASSSLRAALESLSRETSTRSYRRVFYYLALTDLYAGNERDGYLRLIRLRRMALDSRDQATEADARLMIGNLKGRRGQIKDAVGQMEKALQSARRAGLPSKEAKVLTNLCLMEFFLEPQRGLARSDEALEAAQGIGAKVLLVHIHNNRALIHAAMGQKRQALAELASARKLRTEAGYEGGEKSFANWQREVKRILRLPHPENRQDWQDRFLPLPPPQSSVLLEEPRE